MSPTSAEDAPSLDADGWYRLAARVPSPNFDDRPEGTAISLLVVHNISLPAGRYGTSCISDLFCNRLDCDADPSFAQLRGVRVSAHFLIRRDGQLIQFVSAASRAWHAGISAFGGRDRCNDFSIGVELEGTDADVFTDAQYQALSRLTAALQRRYPLADVAGHQHVAPGRKTDPGPFFDWLRYRTLHAQCRPHAFTQAPLRFFALG
jgi:AmpD protein